MQFENAGYEVQDLGGSKVELTRTLDPGVGDAFVVKHIYNLDTQEAEQTERYRAGNKIAKHTIEQRGGNRALRSELHPQDADVEPFVTRFTVSEP